MAKKSTKKKNVRRCSTKILPAVGSSIEGINYSQLKSGECFLYADGLWMKESDEEGCSGDQSAVDLATGRYKDCLCGTRVIPVNVTINWGRK